VIDSFEFTVLLIDDHSMTRLGMKTLAQSSEHLRIRWLDASTLAEAMALYRSEAHVDLVLLDLNLPDSQGLHSIHRFLWEFPAARLVVFSASSDASIVQQAEALGAISYLTKNATAETSIRQLEALLRRPATTASAQGDTCPAPANTPRVHAAMGHRHTAIVEKLNPTQLSVLELMLAGLSNQQIAQELKLALGTVKNCVSSIMQTFEVESRSHLLSLFM